MARAKHQPTEIAFRDDTINRLVLVSDTHGRIRPEVMPLVREADATVHCGDVGGTEVLARLRRAAGGRLFAVRGNNDTPGKWRDGDFPDDRELPAVVRLTVRGATIVVVHGHQWRSAARRHRQLRERFPGARLICYGHSHHRVADLDEKPWIVNPGACGYSRPYGGASIMTVDLTSEPWVVEDVRL